MNNQFLTRLYQNFKVLYEARGRDRLKFNAITEKYFTELLKLLITLSTGMIAFLSVAPFFDSSKIPYKLIPIVSFILTILFAVLSYLSLTLHYKRYTDEATADEANLFAMWTSQKIKELHQRIKEDEEEFKKRKGADWQISTIILGVICLVLFFISTIFVVYITFNVISHTKFDKIQNNKLITNQSSGPDSAASAAPSGR